MFDFPDPSRVVGRRHTSTVAPQALFLLNHPFVRGNAEAAAARFLASFESPDVDARLERVYRRVMGRSPRAGELRVARDFLAGVASDGAADAWTDVVHALFASADFRHVD